MGAPRLLLGAASLFWGGLVGHPLVGLGIAVVVEARHWTPVRWNFGETAFRNAWNASVLLIGLAALLAWLDGNGLLALARTVVWLPLLLLPLQFVQSYGISRSMPLSTFSMFVRKRKKHAATYGLPFRDVRFCFDHAFLAAILISSSIGRFANDTPLFLPGAAVLLFWALSRQWRAAGRLVPLTALAMAVLGIAGAYLGERAIDSLEDRFTRGSRGSGSDYMLQTQTAIGTFEEVKQSPEIIWRIRHLEGPLPTHLRLASYNSYRNAAWTARRPPEVNSISDDFRELTLGSDPELPVRLAAINVDEAAATAAGLPAFELRGATPGRGLLPVPPGAGSLFDLDADAVERNSLGSLRIFPKNPVARFAVRWNREFNTAEPPWEDTHQDGRPMVPDLYVPASEKEDIAVVAREIGLAEGTLAEKVRKLRSHFLRNFTYTRYLDRTRPRRGKRQRTNFVGIFLRETRAGHCEYFATATTLLLREVGIPARYCIGFSGGTTSRDRKTAVIRGTNAHAWCTAWDEERQRWITVDLTPPNWLESDRLDRPIWQPLADRWQILREDLLIWRSQPGNLAITLAIIAVPLGVGGYLIGRRLWRSRQRLDPVSQRRRVSDESLLTPLTELEKPASRILGPRPPHLPLATWLVGLEGHLSPAAPLLEALQLHERIRFDPAPAEAGLRERLEESARQLLEEIKRGPTPDSRRK